MAFSLIDQIVDVQPAGDVVPTRLTATKCLTLGEEYLQDHFPLFPVMPGVMMLEALYQAAAWLLRERDAFAYSMVMLHEAKTVKYSGFVRPGQTLSMEVEFQGEADNLVWLKAKGDVDGATVVRARLALARYNRADKGRPEDAAEDDQMREAMKARYTQLRSASAALS